MSSPLQVFRFWDITPLFGKMVLNGGNVVAELLLVQLRGAADNDISAHDFLRCAIKKLRLAPFMYFLSGEPLSGAVKHMLADSRVHHAPQVTILFF